LSTPLPTKIIAPITNQVNQSGTDTNDQQGGDTIELKAEILRWIFSISGSLLVYILFAVIVTAVYHPDIDELKRSAQSLLIDYQRVLPEPLEAFLFRSGIVIILSSLFGLYIWFSRSNFVASLASKRAFTIISLSAVVIIAALIIIDFAAPNLSDFGGRRFPPTEPEYTNNNFNFYFNEFFLGSYLWLYVLLVIPAVVIFFFKGIRIMHLDTRKSYRILVPFIGYLVTGAVVLAIVLMNIFSLPCSVDNTIDFNAVYYSMTQVYAGVPMLVNGFTNTYGLYPHFLNLIFQFTGLNIFKFTLVLSLLLGGSFVLNFMALRKLVSNRVILFLGFATMIFFSYLDRKLLNKFDCYFALFPIRYIAPSVLVFLAGVYVLKPSRWLYWLMWISMGFFVLWNPEMGLVSYVSMVLFFVYTGFFSADGKPATKKIAAHLISGIVVLPLVFYIYKLLIFAIYGSAPDLSLLFTTMAVFSKVGFALLPMALVHPWNLVVLILISGFAYALMLWYKKAITPKSSLVFLLSLIGVGYLFYYQGRSHSVNLSVSTGFCLLMLTILGDELWLVVKSAKILALNAFFVVFLFLISFSFIELITGAGRIYSTMQEQDKDDKEVKILERFLESNRNLMASNTHELEKILLLTVAKNQCLYFGDNKLRSAFNPGFVEMFLNTDIERFNRIVYDSSFSIFIEPIMLDYPCLQRALATIGARYEFKGFGKTMAMLKRRTAIIPATSFFHDSVNQLLYRKYNDDTTGINARVADALSSSTVTLPPEFSVQVFFQSRIQVIRNAALIGNQADSNGFAIGNLFNSQDYWFGINNEGVKVHLPQNKWMYVVMNVFPDHIAVYLNGSQAATQPLSRPINQSRIPLTIGNLGYQQFYIGAISEIAITGSCLSPEQIHEIWGRIEKEVGK